MEFKSIMGTSQLSGNQSILSGFSAKKLGGIFVVAALTFFGTKSPLATVVTVVTGIATIAFLNYRQSRQAEASRGEETIPEAPPLDGSFLKAEQAVPVESDTAKIVSKVAPKPVVLVGGPAPIALPGLANGMLQLKRTGTSAERLSNETPVTRVAASGRERRPFDNVLLGARAVRPTPPRPEKPTITRPDAPETRSISEKIAALQGK